MRDFESGRRYEVRLEVTGPDGVRHQRRRRFRTVKAACEAWLAGKHIKPTTHAAYSAALAPVIEKYGDRPVQKIGKADVEKLVVELRDGTGSRGVWRARPSTRCSRGGGPCGKTFRLKASCRGTS